MSALQLVFVLAAMSAVVSGHNITAMLKDFPEYSEFSDYLTKTRLADEVNSRQTITVLALTNSEMDAIAKKPLSVIKSVLSLHIVLDYYDPQKLHKIPEGSTLTTTLYQTTGNAPGKLGFVNITDLKGGKVGFGSAAPGSKLDSSYTKSVKQIPYNISVLEISQPILAPGILTAPAPSASDVNVTALLEKAGCKTFASLIASTGVVKTYSAAMEKGLTVFAPNDEAFKAEDVPDLTKLTSAETVSLLLYHSLPSYTPKGTLKTTKGSLSTLATGGSGKYGITVTTAGDDVTLHTGVGPSRLADTVVDSPPFVIFSVDSVLLPFELFGKAPAPAPAGEPVAAPAPEPVLPPTPASAPSPLADSPPAPPMDSPDGSPAGGPGADAADSTAPNGAGALAPVPALFVVMAMVLMS